MHSLVRESQILVGKPAFSRRGIRIEVGVARE
jgi:hypothetical protein